MSASSDTTPPVIVGGREQLVHLLAEASEIEHALMCTYLYAAFSLKGGEDGGLRAEEADAVVRWQKAILAVATDETVHLLLVANLSIAIGGRPHFRRPNFPVSPGTFPADLVARLAPFSAATLDHFIFLERPKGADLSDGEGFEVDVGYEREEAYHGVMPSIQDYATVGDLYEAIRANLREISAGIGEEQLFIGPTSSQVGNETVNLEGVCVVGDLADAERAIDTIIEQGEGSPNDRVDSHYQRFVGMQREYRALLERNRNFAPARPVALNPVMRKPPDPQGKIFIDASPAAEALDLANAIYGLLLQLLVQAFARTGGALHRGQTRHLSAAISLMHALAQAASALTRLPASNSHPGITAGVTFTMPRSVEPLFFGRVEETLILERFDELISASRKTSEQIPALVGLPQLLAQTRDKYSSDPDM